MDEIFIILYEETTAGQQDNRISGRQAGRSRTTGYQAIIARETGRGVGVGAANESAKRNGIRNRHGP